MVNSTTMIEGFELEPGEVIGSRFSVERSDRLDTAWPLIAVDLRHGHQPVQLAVKPVGPLLQDDTAVGDWDEPWARPHHASLLPMIHCPRLRHGGGVLAVCATVHLAPAATDPCHALTDIEHWGDSLVCDEVMEAPSIVSQQLACLRLLHQVSSAIEQTHQSHQPHGNLTWMDFRCDPDGRLFLRQTPPWNRHVGPAHRAMAEDQAALQRMVCEVASTSRTPDIDEDALGSVNSEAGLVRDRLREVLQRKFRTTGNDADITAWRFVLDQLIREIEATVLTDAARAARQAAIESLLSRSNSVGASGGNSGGGGLEDALEMTSTSPDPWCRDLHSRLQVRQARTRAEFDNWRTNAAQRPLLESCLELSQVMRRGVALPTPPSVSALDQRLKTCALHLRQAATAMQNRSWQQARHALSAAASLDPANPTLASLMACLPPDPRNPRYPRNPDIAAHGNIGA